MTDEQQPKKENDFTLNNYFKNRDNMKCSSMMAEN